MNRSRHDFGVSGGDDEASQAGAIAIVGAACRLPGAPDLDSFWQLLIEGRDAVTEIPDDRWNKAQLLHPEKGHRGKAYTFAAGTLGDVSGFDPAFFGISPREATQMDPQQRLLLELAYEAIEDAGIDMVELAGRNVGVFVGGSSWDYLNLNVADVSTTDPYSMIGVTLSILSNRISHVFDLHGPSFTIDTACSSSLVALHQACEAIRAGQIEAAIVGGVSLLLAPQSFVGFCAASMLSPKGRCHAFGADADGYVRSEGGGIVILKPLADAIAAGDPVRAVIRGTGVNSDGRTTGLSLPNRDAQAALLTQVYGRFGIDPESLSYLEAHGTGTQAGDPIEANALGSVLGRPRTNPLPIGSVKTNIGHLEAGSGMAGLLKAMLVAQHGAIPPSLHSAAANPNIAFDELNLRLAHDLEPLPEGRRTIGINSFGFGGTNAHAVLESRSLFSVAEKDVRRPSGDGVRRDDALEVLPPLLLAARSDAALVAVATQWRDVIRRTAHDRPALAALFRGAARHRSQHKRRLVALGADASELDAALSAHIETRAHSRLVTNTAVAGKIAFIFSGNGSQWAGMASDAMAGSAAFRNALSMVDAALRPHLGWSVIDMLAAADADRLRNTDVAQPSLFAVQVALTIALRDYGIEAQAAMGHSVGEVAAAWASGALDLESAARVISARSRAQQARHGIGAMAVLGFGAENAAKALAEAGFDLRGIEIAAHNSGAAVTVAGPIDVIEALEEESKARGWRFTRLDLDYAFHSAAMDPIESDIRADLADLAPGKSDTLFVSTVTGQALDGTELDAGYWWRNVRQPVLFAEAAKALVADGYRIFVEVGPHPVVQAYLNDALRLGDKEGRVVPTLSRRPIKHDPIAAIAARVHAAGGDIRGGAVFADMAELQGLPRYPWQRERFWVPRTNESTDPATVPYDHPLLGQRVGPQPLEWVRHLGIEQLPWLADHVVGGAAVMPAAAMLDLALAAARQRKPGALALELLEVEIGRALVLEPHVMRELRLRVSAATGEFEFASHPRLTDDPWTIHMSGRLVESDSLASSGSVTATETAASAHLSGASLYALASRLGLDYGPAFRVVDSIDITGEDSAVVRFCDAPDLGAGYLLAPNLLDGALQGLLALAADRLGEDMGVLPWRFGRIRLLTPEGAVPVEARLAVTRVGPRSVRANVALIDAGGAIIAELVDCWFVRVAMSRGSRNDEHYFHPALVTSQLRGSVAATAELSIATVIGSIAEPAVEEGRLLADAFASAIAAETLRSLVPGSGRLFPQDLFRTGQVSPESRPQFDQLLRWLAADGLAEQDGDGSWSFATQDLPPSDAILRTLLYDAPLAVADVALLSLAGQTLPVLLRDGSGVAPALPPALWDQFLSDSPSGEAGIEALVAAVVRAVASRPKGHPFRILEVGARRGRLSRELLRRLDDPELRLVAATTPDDLPALAEALSSEPRAGAIGWSPGETLDDDPFDLIVGMHSLSLADDGGANVASLAAPLAPGGFVLLAEPGANRVWPLLRPFLAPPSDAGRWTALLARAGFESLQSRPIAGGLWPMDLIAGKLSRVQSAAPAPTRPIHVVSADGDELAEAIAGRVDREVRVCGLDDIGTITGAVAIVFGTRLPRLEERLALIAGLSALPIDAKHDITLIVHGRADGDTDAAALMGARRVLANEAAHVRLRLVRLDPDLPLDAAAAYAAAELASPDDENEIAWTTHGRVVTRVRNGLPDAEAVKSGALRLAIQRPGLLDSLGWQEGDVTAPKANEVAIEVKAAGLNFRDVMWSMGLLPDEALLDGFAGPTLGLECAGLVTAVGEGVTAFAPGDRVMAFAPASLSTRTVTAAHAIMRMPAGLDFAAAATVPVAFLTVAYSLGHLARITSGETVLVHGGAGGVGLAAIQYALHRGARVLATAGSPAKRALLQNLGVEAVLDSRSLSFGDDVMRLTGGEGVDVVLNSLSGEAMRRSLGLVKPFGRFLELGKRDFYENSSVGLRPFRHNVSYFGIDADQLPLKQPKLAADLFDEIATLFAEGALRPLPHRTFDYADAESAFRLMQSAGHIGKIVLTPGPVAPRRITTACTFAAGPGVYVVTGGLDGFGREAARWLARNGARKIGLLSRRGPAIEGADALLADFAQMGVAAKAYAVDVADEAKLATTLDMIRADLGPISGVVHAAVAMDDALLSALDAGRFERALAPKLRGALALDRLTRQDPIDLFLLFSSVTTPLGNPGQGNYVAANAAIEALAERRHAEGLPALAIQWGPIGDAGYLARELQVSEMLTKQLGGAHLSAQEALNRIPTLLASGIPVAGVATVRWGAMKSRLPLVASPLFSEMALSGTDEAGEIDLAALLSDLSPEEARERVTALLVEEVARIMKLAPERVEAQRPLAELGMDSLMAVELRLAVEHRFGLSIPLLALSEGATLSAMAGRIIRGLGSEGDGAPTDETSKLLERLALHEGSSGIPTAEAIPAAEPGMAAVAAGAP
ncbi:type I polyketide synthase [Sphingomonas sp. BIUV-7]|uniref:Type I polyketide synthase n=1 Tax=Sphingomonas natans TaxID=3063330 RepID=A0ABT8Y5Q7_9SPHN|nr:type I polyketide synthase [Sphingomonas sp. BIUV-7]MDO6413649.1 type I polyketide synthase [Sphingomonas sp. BIUV-7]